MIHCNFYTFDVRSGKPSERKKLCKDNVKPYYCVPSPILKIIVPPDSSGSSVPQIADYDLEQSHSPTNRNGLQQLFSIEQNQGFPQTQRRHKQRCALLGLDRPVVEFKDVEAGKSRWISSIVRSGRFPCTQSLPQRKVESSFGGFCCMAPFTAKGGKKLFVLLGSKKRGHWVGVLSRHPWC